MTANALERRGIDETNRPTSCVEPAVMMQRLLENISGDLRGALTVAKEFTSIILDGLAGEVPVRQREYLQAVAESVDELDAMIGDLVDVSRFDAAMVGVYRRPCRASDFLAPLRVKLARRAAVHHVRFEVREADDLPTLFCDPEQVARVITRLVAHAFRAVGSSGSVHLRVRQAAEDDASVLCEVEDDGPSASVEKLQLIQERFRSNDCGAGASAVDLDPGLIVVKQLVALNLGEIVVSSASGRGTTFAFSVPAAEPFKLVQRFLSYSAGLRGGAPFASMHTIRVDENADVAALAEIGFFLHHHLRCSDMVFPIEPHVWLVVLPSNRRDPSAMLRRLESAWSESNANRPGRSLPLISVESRGCWHVERQGSELLVELHRVLQAHQAATA